MKIDDGAQMLASLKKCFFGEILVSD